MTKYLATLLQYQLSDGCQFWVYLVSSSTNDTQVTLLDFAPEHALSSNELVEVVKKNILLGDWGDEDHNESLLSMRNSKWGQEMLRNVRYVGVLRRVHPCF